GRDFELGAHRKSSVLAIECDVFHQTKGNGIRDALDVASIAVEEAADHLHVVAVLTVDFAVRQFGDIDAGYDRQFGFGVADLRQLRRHIDGDVVNLLPAENRFVNFLLGDFARTDEVIGGVIPIAGLHVEAALLLHADFQGMELAIGSEVFGGEAEQVGDLGRLDQIRECAFQIVGVIEEFASRAIGQVPQNFGLGGFLQRVHRPAVMRRHQAAGIEGVDDYAGADCLIDQSVVPQHRGGADETGGCQNQDTLPRLFAHETNYVAHIGKHVSHADV